MAKERYVAYVGTYTNGSSVGIHIYDIEPERWNLIERKVVPINNPSYIILANSGKYLYAIADQGVQSFKILSDGDLEPMNCQWTGGLRGCTLEIDPQDRYLFVGGYHDGRVSVMKLNEDGTIGDIADGVFHQGIGLSITDRRSMPHVTCVKLTPDFGGLCAVDSGLDQVKIYEVDYKTGKLRLEDIIRCELESGPHLLQVDKQRKFLYVLGERSNRVCVYQSVHRAGADKDDFECIQKISTIEPNEHQQAAAAGFAFSHDRKHLFVANAGINSVIVYDVDEETGMLSKLCHIKCSGDYPKALYIMPDDIHFAVLSHNTNEMFIYQMNYEGKYFLMNSKPVKIEKPNCIVCHKISADE